MNEVERNLSELYPNYTIQPPLNMELRRPDWQTHPLPSDYLIIPPGFHDDTPSLTEHDWMRITKKDNDLCLSIRTFPKVVDTFSRMEVAPGDYATEVLLPETETFQQCGVRNLIEMGPNGENFNLALSRLLDDAAELRTAKRRVEALLAVDTAKLPISESAMAEFEADFVDLYRKLLQEESGQKITLSGEAHLHIAEKLTMHFLCHDEDYDIDDTDLYLLLDEYTPYGKTIINIPGANASSYSSFVINQAKLAADVWRSEAGEKENAEEG